MPNSHPTLPSTQTADRIRDHVDSEIYEAVGLIFMDGSTVALHNQAQSASRFFVNPNQIRDVMLDRHIKGYETRVWGVYHSHVLPDSTSNPSGEDVEFMRQVSGTWTDVKHVIVTDSDMAVWVMNGEGPVQA